MNTRRLAQFWISGCVATLALLNAQTGSISGSVTLEDGTPVGSASVLCMRAPDLARGPKGHIYTRPSAYSSSTVLTDSAGAFQITGLPAGAYYLCASAGDPTLVRSCDWTDSDPAINLAPGGQVQGRVLLLRKGTWLYLSVSDPAGRLSAPYVFFAGVITDFGYYQPFLADPNFSDKGHYRLLVPPGISARLIIDTPLTVTDQVGMVPSRVPSRSVTFSPQAAAPNSAVPIELTIQ